MNSTDDALRVLTGQMRYGDGTDPHRDREALEASLVPLIRRAITSGRGLPPLVQWVKRHLPDQAPAGGRNSDPDRAAPSMARLLCTTLLRQAGSAPASARETVVGL